MPLSRWRAVDFNSRAELKRHPFLKRCSVTRLLRVVMDIGIIINPDNRESSFLVHFSSFSKDAQAEEFEDDSTVRKKPNTVEGVPRST